MSGDWHLGERIDISVHGLSIRTKGMESERHRARQRGTERRREAQREAERHRERQRRG